MKKLVCAVLGTVVSLVAAAEVVEWEFPRLGSCHEGLAFADGKTTATIGRRACELQVMPDGLYLNVMKRGLALSVK